MPLDKATMLANINRLLHVDGNAISALDVIDSCNQETLVKTLTAVVMALQTP